MSTDNAVEVKEGKTELEIKTPKLKVVLKPKTELETETPKLKVVLKPLKLKIELKHPVVAYDLKSLMVALPAYDFKSLIGIPKDNATWTITMSERIENHVGMQTIGEMALDGFSMDDMKNFRDICLAKAFMVEEINLEANLPSHLVSGQTKASVLIVRGGIKMLAGDDYVNFLTEVKSSANIVDKKAWMKGKVVNKQVRYNLCYGNEAQKADYENKKGTIVAFKDVPYLQKVRARLGEFFGKKCTNMLGELNYYYDINKCGISSHGDSERRRVIGLRVGTSMNLKYQWFHQFKPVGEGIMLNLNEGDFYIMSEKAVGTDWKKSKIPTLRHSAGADKYTTIKPK